jgi:hypothetical protein
MACEQLLDEISIKVMLEKDPVILWGGKLTAR